MAIEVINVGTVPNDGTGDGLRTAYIKCNDNFAFLNSRVKTSVPTTSLGSVGDIVGNYAVDSGFFYICFQDYDGSSVIWGRVALDTSW
jgi:hypothetical protein